MAQLISADSRPHYELKRIAVESSVPESSDQSALTRLGQLTVLLVCTGNTCRSPMAEAILRNLLSERFATQFSDGQPPPAVAVSAGLSAFPGGPASPEAVSVMKERGLSLVHHQSRAVSDRLISHADLVLTMTRSHRNAIVQRWPELASKTHLLSDNNGDVLRPVLAVQSPFMPLVRFKSSSIFAAGSIKSWKNGFRCGR